MEVVVSLCRLLPDIFSTVYARGMRQEHHAHIYFQIHSHQGHFISIRSINMYVFGVSRNQRFSLAPEITWIMKETVLALRKEKENHGYIHNLFCNNKLSLWISALPLLGLYL